MFNSNNDRSVFLCNCFSFGQKGRKLGIYLAGILFAMGWWAFIDGLLQLANLEDRQVAPGIEDWIPGILTTFGFIVVSVIDKNAIRGGWGYDEDYAWRARLFLFLGFTLLAGGLAGSVAVLVTKYIYHDGLDIFNMYLGIMDVVQNLFLMFSTAVLWLTQSHNTEENFRL